jgi:hypothetical protein
MPKNGDNALGYRKVVGQLAKTRPLSGFLDPFICKKKLKFPYIIII